MKKRIIILIVAIVLLIIAMTLIIVKINTKKKVVKKTTTTVTTTKFDADKYKDLKTVRTTKIKGNNYEASIIDDELIVAFDGKGVRVSGIDSKVKYITDLGNFISYEPTFVVIAEDGVYVGEIDSSEELTFSKIKEDVKDVYLVSELDYSFGYVKQAYALLSTGELKKIEYNGYSKRVSLSKTYENRDVDVFLWGNGGMVLRVDKGKDNLLLTKSQTEEYDEKHEMVVKLDFVPMLYNGKKVNAKYVILSDEGYKVYVVANNSEVLYANQDKDMPNQNVLELEKYKSKKVSEVEIQKNKIISIKYDDNSSEELNYDILYEGSKE